MKFIENVIQNIIVLYLVFVYLSYIVGILVAEILYLKKNRKKALMVVCFSILVSCIACVLVPTKYETSKYRLQSLNIYEKDESIGRLPVLVDSNNQLAGIGYFIKDGEIGPVAYMVNVENGNIKSEGNSYDGDSYDEAIKKALHEQGVSEEKFSGKTKSYEKLKQMAREKKFVSFSSYNLSVKYVLCVIPSVASILIYTIFVGRQKKKIMMKKSKLQDL